MSGSTLFPFLPGWPLSFGQLGWFALLLLAATFLGEVGARLLRLPRLVGWIVAGLALGPYPIGLLSVETLRSMRPVIDVTLGLLLFELGWRLDLSWLRRNPWLLAASLFEAGLTAVLVFVALRLTGMDSIYAAAAAAIAISTSPAVIVQLTRELRAQGQVTERLLMLTALNSMYAVFAITMWLAWLHLEYKGTPITIGLHPLYLILGSAGLALAGALGARLVPGSFRRHEDTQLLLVLGLVVLLIAVADTLQASVFLTLLCFGIFAKSLVDWLHVLPNHFTTIVSISMVVLFALVGAGLDPGTLADALPAALAFVGARLVAKWFAVVVTARPSGLAPRKGTLLGLGLAPMSGLAIVLVQDTSGIYPDFPTNLLVVVVAAVVLLGLGGPLLTRVALVASGESRPE